MPIVHTERRGQQHEKAFLGYPAGPVPGLTACGTRTPTREEGVEFLDLKSDEALFQIRLDPTYKFQDNFSNRYGEAVGKAFKKFSAGGLQYSYSYKRSNLDKDERKESAKILAAQNVVSRTFRQVNVWLERDFLKERTYIGLFAAITSPLFTLDDGSEFQLDYFQETEKNHIWLEDYMEDLEFAVLHVSEMVKRVRTNRKRLLVAALLAVLALLLLVAVKSPAIWESIPIIQLALAPLFITAGAGAAVLLVIWLFYCFADRRSERQKLYDAFMQEAENRVPLIHRILRFYALWGRERNRELPPKLARITRYTEEVVNLYDEIARGQLPTDRPRKRPEVSEAAVPPSHTDGAKPDSPH